MICKLKKRILYLVIFSEINLDKLWNLSTGLESIFWIVLKVCFYLYNH